MTFAFKILSDMCQSCLICPSLAEIVECSLKDPTNLSNVFILHFVDNDIHVGSISHRSIKLKLGELETIRLAFHLTYDRWYTTDMNKIAVITGASYGLGSSISSKLIELGYKVYGISRTKPSISGPNFIWIKADLLNS